MTPATLPQCLWRPAQEVKSYVEKHPDGVTLTRVSKNVEVFNTLCMKDKRTLIAHLNTHENIMVSRTKKPDGERLVTTLTIKKPGAPYPAWFVLKLCTKCGKHKDLSDFYKSSLSPDGCQTYCKECKKKLSSERYHNKKRHKTQSDEIVPLERAPVEITRAVRTPAEIRRQIAQLEIDAQEAERQLNENDVFNKKLDPVRREILHAATKVERHVDEYIDLVAELRTAVNKLKELSA